MKKIDELKNLESTTGFSNVFSLLKNILRSIISVVEIPQNLQKLNTDTRETIKGIKDAATSFLMGPLSALRKISIARQLLEKAEKEISNLKDTLDLVDSDFESIIETNPLKSLTFVLLAIGIILLDYLVGGVMVFKSNQSPLTAALLMFAAILAAYFFYLAGPAFSVGKRMRAEVRRANNDMHGHMGAAVKQTYETQPELSLPGWMRPSGKMLSHNEGNISFVKGNWILKRNEKMAYLWLIMGTVFSFLRLLPVIVDPSLYGQKAIIWQIVILIIALVINSVILLLELWRRKDSGLPNSIQKLVNKELIDKKNALKVLGDGNQEVTLTKQAESLNKNTEDALIQVKHSYKESFANIIAQKNGFSSLIETYRQTYTENIAIIESFYAGLPTIGFDVEPYSAQIPTPELVASTYSSNQDDHQVLEIDEHEFVFVEPVNN